MGSYNLIPDDSCFGRPVWQKGEDFLMMDNLGSWVVSATHLCKKQLSKNSVYFGVHYSYLNTKLPILSKLVWSHIDMDSNINDTLFQVTDICNRDDQRLPFTLQGKVASCPCHLLDQILFLPTKKNFANEKQNFVDEKLIL